MKISLDWLNSYLDRPAQEQEIEPAMTAAGFQLDGRQAVDGTDDVMLDLEVTSNRSDCLSHVGMARELAAASGRTLKNPDCQGPDPQASEAAGALSAGVENHEPALCAVYTARVIRGVKVGPSPVWLTQRLEAVGLRSINNVVDVTNFVLLELGQPLHAFDLGKLAEQRIVVRRAAAGEIFSAIDGSKHELQDHMLVIADAHRPVALAGVMGGLASEVGPTTTDILLESAIFDPLSVRKTSRALKLASDSSFRFERGVDPVGVDRASRRAAGLIVELAGGHLAGDVVRVGDHEPQLHEVSMRVSRCNALLGLDLDAGEQSEYLDSLGLQPRVDGEAIICTIPSYRLDLHREVDLIEEVARRYGLERIGVQETIHIVVRLPQPQVRARDELCRVLVAHGFHETINFSFISPRVGEAFVSQEAQAVLIDDERRRAEPMLRPSVLVSLLGCRKSNQDRGNHGIGLFETAAVWDQHQQQIREREALGMLVDAEDQDQALRQLRGCIEELIETLGGAAVVGRLQFKPTEAANFAIAADVCLDEKLLGTMGLIDGATCSLFGLQTPVAGAELDVLPLLELYPPQRQIGALPRFPAIERDLSIVVDESVTWQTIEQTVRDAKPDLLESIAFLGVYRGKPIVKTKKSVSFRMLFRDPVSTLRHDQVDTQVSSVVGLLTDSLQAELRS
jgi:phenylalanyl-tRNA synthetase beta chain